jgi:hypothetical protein
MWGFKTRVCLVAAILCLTIWSAAQAPSPFAPSTPKGSARLPEQDDVIENGAYSNHFFGFSLSIPEGWKAENYDTVQADRKKYPVVVVPHLATSSPLGTVLFEMFPAESKSPVLLVSHLDLKNIKGINTASDFTIPLAEAIRSKKGAPEFQNVKGPTPYPLGELTASRIDCLRRS